MFGSFDFICIFLTFSSVHASNSLVTLQAQFNEGLITMYAGYHPDHFWKNEADDFVPFSKSRSASSSPTEKKSENLSSVKSPDDNDHTNNSRPNTVPEQQFTMEEQMKRLINQLEQQSVQIEKQSLELDSLRSLVKKQEGIKNEHGASNDENRKEK